MLEDGGAIISNIKILEKWTEKYQSPPRLMILLNNENTPMEEIEQRSQVEQMQMEQTGIVTNAMAPPIPRSLDDSRTNAIETRPTAEVTQTSNDQELEVIRNQECREPVHCPSWSWSELPRQIIDKCKEQKRALKCERDLLVNLITMYLMNDLKDTSQATIRTMASDICQLYPATFADRLGDTVLGTKSEVLAKQLSRSVAYRKKMANPVILDHQTGPTNRGQKRKRKDSISLDSHGCVLWEPPIPPGESAESQRTAQGILKEKAKSTDRQECEILDALIGSYATQRMQINRRSGLIVDVLEEWPFLMESSYFLWHATKLLGKNVDEIFRGTLNAHSVIYRYINYYQIERCNSQAQQLKNMRKILTTSASAMERLGNNACQQLAIIPLLTEYFKEDANLLYLVMDVSIFFKVKNILDNTA